MTVSFFRTLIFVTLCIITGSFYAQPTSWDTLNIRYEIISQQFYQSQNIIKIKVPPYLSTPEVMEQIKLALQWPGDPPPEKRTNIYVFKDTNQIGDSSHTGATFIPGRGYIWKLEDWKPIEFPLVEPTQLERVIYNTFLDSIFAHGLTTYNSEVKEKVAKRFNITVSKLDSIYFKVKYWKSY